MIKHIFNKLLSVFICVLIFLLFVYVDYNYPSVDLMKQQVQSFGGGTEPSNRNYYTVEPFETAHPLTREYLKGDETDTIHGAIPYVSMAQWLKYPTQSSAIEDISGTFGIPATSASFIESVFDPSGSTEIDAEKEAQEYSVMMNSPENERIYTLSEIKKDLQYFNNSTHLKQAMSGNNPSTN